MAVFRCEKCERYLDESELAEDQEDDNTWICLECGPCDCGERKCFECGPRMIESESDLVDMRKDGGA